MILAELSQHNKPKHKMYVDKTFINLATNASAVNDNLALQHGNDLDILASTLAVIQDGYVNIVPILNASRRSKYIPISQEERGAGVVKEVIQHSTNLKTQPNINIIIGQMARNLAENLFRRIIIKWRPSL